MWSPERLSSTLGACACAVNEGCVECFTVVTSFMVSVNDQQEPLAILVAVVAAFSRLDRVCSCGSTLQPQRKPCRDSVPLPTPSVDWHQGGPYTGDEWNSKGAACAERLWVGGDGGRWERGRRILHSRRNDPTQPIVPLLSLETLFSHLQMESNLNPALRRTTLNHIPQCRIRNVLPCFCCSGCCTMSP